MTTIDFETKIFFLKKLKNGTNIEENEYKDLLENIKKGIDLRDTLYCIFEMVRIQPNLFAQRDKDKIISSLIQVMKSETVDLKRFFEENCINAFDLVKHKDHFCGLIKTVKPSNKFNLHKIIAQILDSCDLKDGLIRKVLLQIAKDATYNDVFKYTRTTYDDVVNQELDNMSPKEYLGVFCNLNPFIKHIPRKLGECNSKSIFNSTEKFRYLEAAINKGFINDVIPYYFNDKDLRIRQLLSRNKFAVNEKIISRFLNDNDPQVRCNMIDNLEVEDVLNVDIDVFDRVYDVNDSVRQRAFEFYDKFIVFVKTYFDTSYFKDEGENNCINENVKRAKLTKEGDIDISRTLSNAILKLFRGLFTSCKKAFEDYIDKLDLSLTFYEEFYEETGVEEYLEIRGSDVCKGYNYKFLSQGQKKIYFSYYEGTLKEDEVKELLEDDLVSTFFYLRNKEISNFATEIYKKLRDGNFSLQFKILALEKLKDYKDLLMIDKKDLMEDLLYSAFFNESLIVEGPNYTFIELFYLSKTGKMNEKDFKDNELNNDELLEVLLASKKIAMLSIVTDRLLENSETFKRILYSRMKLQKRMYDFTLNEFISENKHNLYLYILITGNVKIYSDGFFISFLHFMASSSRNKEKVGRLYKQYLGNIPKEIYYEFASICYNLKTKSMYHCEEQEHNIIREKDEIMYFIISVVLNFNVYKINEKKYGLDLFHDVIEENIPYVLTRQ